MTSKRGGKREGAGRKPAPDHAKNRGIRCTDGGWQWLKDQAKQAGASSVGKWADMLGAQAIRPVVEVAQGNDDEGNG